MKNITFTQYVQSTYSQDIASNIINSYQDKLNQRIFKLSVNLGIWSMFGVTADVRMGLLAGYLSYSYGLSFWTVTGPTLCFFILNLIVKFFYVKTFIKGEMSVSLMMLSVIPYFGSGIISGRVLLKHPLFAKAMSTYLTKINSERTFSEKIKLMFSVASSHKNKLALSFCAILVAIILKNIF